MINISEAPDSGRHPELWSGFSGKIRKQSRPRFGNTNTWLDTRLRTYCYIWIAIHLHKAVWIYGQV